MNLSITNLCNRRCEYCFQKEWYLSNKAKFDKSVTEMSIDTIVDIVKWWNQLEKNKERPVKLMGGEPLLHSQIFGVLEAIHSLGKQVAFISNISVDEQIVNKICNDYAGYVFSFLINSDYPNSQEEVFYKNFDTICKSKVPWLSVSSTLMPDLKDQEKSTERLLRCIDIYRRARNDLSNLRIRLSPYCPLSSTDAGFVSHNYTYDLVKLFNTLCATSDEIRIGLDCPLDTSELSAQAAEAFTTGGIMVKNKSCLCNCGAFDVLVDGSIIWCSSCEDIRLNSYKDYKSPKEAKLALREIATKINDKLSDNTKVDFVDRICLAKARVKNVIQIKSVK